MAVDLTRRLLDRLVGLSPLLLLGGLAMLTYWLDAQIQPPPPKSDGSSRHDPDLFIKNVSATVFDAQGRPRQRLQASAQAGELQALEPVLNPLFAKALWIKDSYSVNSPGAVVRAYADAFAARGDCVVIRNADGGEIGRGLIGYDASEALQIMGRSSRDIEEILGYSGRAAMIHRDDMALAGE